MRTERATLLAGQVVVATLLPFLDRGLFFARAFPGRSYVVTARIDGQPPDGMFISAGGPTRSIRAQPVDGEELLLVGGEGHHAGAREAQPERYRKLAAFAREHWRVQSIAHRWSTQDYSPADGVPYIGPLHRWSHRVHVATGFKKWGMTSGTLAAMIISDAILGRGNPWASTFSSTRLRPLAQGPKAVIENARVAARFVGDRVAERGRRAIEELSRCEGAIVSAGGQKVADYRDAEGNLHAVCTHCTHLGCQVAWNLGERLQALRVEDRGPRVVAPGDRIRQQHRRERSGRHAPLLEARRDVDAARAARQRADVGDAVGGAVVLR